MQRMELFGVQFDAATMSESVAWIDKRIAASQFTQHVVINVAKLVNMQNDFVLRESVHSCDLINVDGAGVALGARLMGMKVPERVAGIDLFYELMRLAAERRYPVYFLGAKTEVVEVTAKVLKEQYPGLEVAGYHHGYFWDFEDTVVREIRGSGAKLLFVAITSPKKENFINKWKSELGVDFVMGVGGTFDVVAGRTKRAPLWVQRIGMEWAFRLLQEPGRLWRRYLVTNLMFAWMLMRGSFSKTFREHGVNKGYAVDSWK